MFKTKNAASVSEAFALLVEFSGIHSVNHLFKVDIIDMSKSSRYLEVELKASFTSFRLSFGRDFMKSLLSHSKIETDQKQRGAISSHRNFYILLVKFRAKCNLNIV